MWLPWQWAMWMAVGLLVVSTIAHRTSHRSTRAVAFETAVVLVLYSMWLRAGEFDPFGTSGGLERGLKVWRAERWLHLPREQWLQQGVLANRIVVEASNLYYAGVHVPAMGAFLIWMFFRHRADYGRWRTTLALTTGVCLAIRYLPVAPPRMFPELGFVDTAIRYNQSVYGDLGTGVSGQMAAMPSIHVAWAVIVAVAAMRAGGSRWRWIAVLHGALTIWVVSSTANHWWLDGVGGAIIVGLAWWVVGRLELLVVRIFGKDQVPPVEAVPTAVADEVAGIPATVFGGMGEQMAVPAAVDADDGGLR